MANRKKMKKGQDIGVFKKTYNKTKRINRASAAGAGGIRL